MKKTYLLFFITFTALLLTACVEEGDVRLGEPSDAKSSAIKQEVTLRIEDLLVGEHYHYQFAGFLNDETLAFEVSYGHTVKTSYHPAKIGYKFRFKEMNATSEIIDFNRDEGYVTMKVESKK